MASSLASNSSRFGPGFRSSEIGRITFLWATLAESSDSTLASTGAGAGVASSVGVTALGTTSLPFSCSTAFAKASSLLAAFASTGAGIPPEDISHLFQKFYRVDNSATRTIGGTGLGLFISRKIIELYQGRIWVESTIGKGSTFYINLPRLTTQRAEQLMATEASAEVQTIGSLSPSTTTVTTVAPSVPAGTTS